VVTLTWARRACVRLGCSGAKEPELPFRQFLSSSRILLVAIVIVTGYFLVSAGSNVLRSYELQQEEASLEAEIRDLEQDKQQLSAIRDYLRTDEYLEFMARRVFGLVKPGEKLVVVDAPVPESPDIEPSLLTWWQRLFGGP
jgi:cell division protein FtsB